MPHPSERGAREGMKMDEPHWPGNPVGLGWRVIRRHSGESRNPVFSALVSGLQGDERQGGITVSRGKRELGAITSRLDSGFRQNDKAGGRR
jgi:hypothetical protein